MEEDSYIKGQRAAWKTMLDKCSLELGIFDEPQVARVNEMDYQRGAQMAWQHMLLDCLRQLGVDDPAAQGSAWVSERAATVSKLREACEEFGNQDWPDNLHLADVIEKHLLRQLWAGRGSG